MLDLFAKIAAANATNKGDNFRAGQGVVMVEELIADKMTDGNVFVGRFEIVSAKSKGDRARKTPKEDVPTGDLIEPNAVGAHVGWPQLLDKHKSAPGNVKAFILNLLGYAEKEVTADQFGGAAADLTDKVENAPKDRQRQPARGMLVGFESYDQKVKNGPTAGEWRTYVKFTHIGPEGGNTPELIAKRRAELDARAPLK